MKGKFSDDYLSIRKKKVLWAVVESYTHTAEPVASRTVWKRFDLGVSPATIRNDMADLEEEGFLNQPHISSGRIPSCVGYRYYVDSLMEWSKNRSSQMIETENEFTGENPIDEFLKNIAKQLSSQTLGIAIVSHPLLLELCVRDFHLSYVRRGQCIVFLLLDGGITFTYSLNIDISKDEDALVINSLIKSKILGKNRSEINSEIDSVFAPVFNLSAQAKQILMSVTEHLWKATDKKAYIYYSMKMFNLPDFSDREKFDILVALLEEEDRIVQKLFENPWEKREIKIIIGEENEDPKFWEFTFFKIPYYYADKVVGFIGLISPTRVRYPYVVELLDSYAHKISNALRRLFD
ncbi:heat-inducible transcriptional repressor HrcA [Thermodesulfobium sp. 4217-1]|uniref:heat-inducible transcriptional repressor HrcA n=1 Tax=Thermodesulfobium sp. 4217-1 TaxID=3120013 RepID=UPI0032220854